MSKSFSPPPKTVLPIIQKLIVAYKLWHEYLIRFNKSHRYTIGLQVNNIFLDSIEHTFAAIHKSREAKEVYLVKASEKFDLLKFFLQIAWQIGALETKRYIALSKLLDEIGKMLGG